VRWWGSYARGWRSRVRIPATAHAYISCEKSLDLWLARVWGPPGDFQKKILTFLTLVCHPFSPGSFNRDQRTPLLSRSISPGWTWETYTRLQPGLKHLSLRVIIANLLELLLGGKRRCTTTRRVLRHNGSDEAPHRATSELINPTIQRKRKTVLSIS
jgi:hypothetical protein